jgi:thymidine phosphorylase
LELEKNDNEQGKEIHLAIVSDAVASCQKVVLTIDRERKICGSVMSRKICASSDSKGDVQCDQTSEARGMQIQNTCTDLVMSEI